MDQVSNTLSKHLETYMSLDELGTIFPEYRATYTFANPYIDTSHEFFSTCPVNGAIIQVEKKRGGSGSIIPGWLRREEALKLYEMAYFTSGNILELGSYYGLSTTILAQAVRQSRQRKRI